MSSLYDFMVWQNAYSLTKRLVLAPNGIPAVFHDIDQEVGHEPVHIGRSYIMNPINSN